MKLNDQIKLADDILTRRGVLALSKDTKTSLEVHIWLNQKYSAEPKEYQIKYHYTVLMKIEPKKFDYSIETVKEGTYDKPFEKIDSTFENVISKYIQRGFRPVEMDILWVMQRLYAYLCINSDMFKQSFIDSVKTVLI